MFEDFLEFGSGLGPLTQSEVRQTPEIRRMHGGTQEQNICAQLYNRRWLQ
jgi:hypothetical protein